MIQLATARPKCVQVAEFIEKEILSGNLRPGERLQSVRDQCRDFDTTIAVINSAYDLLEKKKLIRRYPRKGILVARHSVRNPISLEKVGLLTDVFNGRPGYYEAFFRALAARNCSILPTMLSHQSGWEKTVAHLVDEKPSLVLADLEGRFFDGSLLREALGNTPCFFVNQPGPSDFAPKTGIFIDYVGACEKALRIFLKQGCRRICLVGNEEKPSETVSYCMKEAESRCREDYPDLQLRYFYAFEFAVKTEQATEFFRNSPPEAMFGFSDEYLFSLMNVLRLMFPEVLKTMEVIGFHNLFYSRIPKYEFSTFIIDYDQFWNRVFDRITGCCRTVDSPVEYLLPDLILRGTLAEKMKGGDL